VSRAGERAREAAGRAGRWLRRHPRGAAVLGALGLGAVPLLLAVSGSGLVAPEPTLLLLDRHGRFLAEIGASEEGEFGYWHLEALPPRVAAAVLAVEDRRFAYHPGVDPVAVVRALGQNWKSGRRVSGASTVAMQVARMQRPAPRTWWRKGVEALTALLLTARHGRDAVLAHYLRVVPYGNRIHGIAYAARRYLDKPVEDLSWAETAFLCAIPQAPAHMNPFDPTGRQRAVERGVRILDLLRDTGELDTEEHALALRQIRTLRIPPVKERPLCALHAVLGLERRFAQPDLRRERTRHPLVRTSLDLDRQDEVAWIAERAVDRWHAGGARNAAVIVLDRRSAEVLAWVGSTDYFNDDAAGAIDYTRVARSPGSALKPFLYALALERGVITPATILDDIQAGPGGIVNADGRFLGPLLPRVALANSRNVPAAELLSQLGLGAGYSFLAELGLHDGRTAARRYGLGLAIGGLPVTLERLVTAYTALAGDGRLREPVWIAGEKAPSRRVLSEDTAREIALFLSDPMARLPSFPRMGATEYPFPVAVKTGTSSRYRDAWAVGFSTRYLMGVWVGDPEFRPMDHLGGYASAARLLQAVVLRLHPDQADGLSDVSFPPPRGFEPHRLCALTGRLATPACDRVFLEWLRPGEAPVEHCRSHLRLVVDRSSGDLASESTPRGRREVRGFVELPPRYAAWAMAEGLPRPPGLFGGWTSAPGGGRTAARARPVRLSVAAPESGLHVFRDPEVPPDRSTLALRAIVDPPVPQVLWYVDGAPFELAGYPYTARWVLRPGEHRIQARLPGSPVASAEVTVVVQ
jgi:penicillin-binding protein 1C